jgi:hypothetical protein
VFARPGEPRWFPPFKHKVENLGNTAYNAVYIGIKDKRLASQANQKAGPSDLDVQTKKILADALMGAVK